MLQRIKLWQCPDVPYFSPDPSNSTYHITLALKFPQIRILPQLRITRPLQAPPRNLNIRHNILNQALLAHIIILGPNKPQNHQIHMTAVKVPLKLMHNMNLDAAHRVLVKRVPPDAHDHRVHGALVGRQAGRCAFFFFCSVAGDDDGHGIGNFGAGVVDFALGGVLACCGGGRETGPAVVDAGFDVLLAADCEAFDGDVGGGYTELYGLRSVLYNSGLAARSMVPLARSPLCCLDQSL